MLPGGNDEHGDVHRFGNTSQKRNEVSLQLVACFDTNLDILKKIEKNSETKWPVQRCKVKIIIIEIKKEKNERASSSTMRGREKNNGTKE